jgi:adenylyltransferase/sulfurtransferase
VNDGARYRSQVRVIGAAGQQRLAQATVVVVGVGATGGAIAEILARAGVGRLRLIDRDLPELSNLQRQVLFDEEDVAAALPKAEAGRRRLSRINAGLQLSAEVADLGPGNALGLLEGADLVMDGTDNFLARFVINDACLALGVPWIYCGVVGTAVHGFPVIPGRTPCFRCYLERLPPPGSTETCDTAGVLGPTVLVGAGLAAAEAIKLLADPDAEPARGLLIQDVWTRDARRVGFAADPTCPACQLGEREFLDRGSRGEAELCGQDAVMVRPPTAVALDLEALAARLGEVGQVTTRNAFLLRFQPHDTEHELTVFRDGRAIVKGTQEAAQARSLYARFVGT